MTHFENHVLGGNDLAPGAPAEAPSSTGSSSSSSISPSPISAARARPGTPPSPSSIRMCGRTTGSGSCPIRRCAALSIHEYLSTDHARVRSIVEAFGLRAATGRGESLTSFLYADELRHMQDSGDGDGGAGRVAGRGSRPG
ncbi:MAG: hypothetical protein MZV64_52580 [Ignavibacteriales bacterium]|nr:hypothetical protein [Ignavibacteriales bacterium]